MRSLKTGLLTFVTAGFFGMAAVIGCSADGAGDVIEDPNATEPTGDDGAQLPPSNPGSSSSSSGSTAKDAGKDASKSDAGKDAGPPPPDPGTACAKVDQIFTRTCGMCGTQKAVCLAEGDGGAGKVSDYSPCEGEKGVCVAGTVEDVACGNCGTAKRTCNQYCAWSTGACGGQPANSCTPGAVELQNAGCTVPDTYRQRSCQNNCIWENYSQTCSPPPTFLLVPPTVGSVNSAQISLKSSQVAPRVTGSCPSATVSTTATTPYNYFEIRNPTTKAATVSIYHSAAMGGTAIDTVIAAYDGATPPASEAERKACVKGVGDYGTTALTGDSDFASLDGTKAVTIPAGGSVTVYSASYYAYDAATPSESTGPLKINVKVESFQ